MFKREIKFVYDFCLNKISNSGSAITHEKLEAIKIHPAILKFISADVDHRIYKDHQVLLQKSSFDYSSKAVSKYFSMIANEFKKSRIIPQDEISDLIHKAVSFNFGFTTAPNETLINFIYIDSQSKTPEDISMLLEYTYYYDYLKQIIIQYFKKKNPVSVNKQEFEMLLKKIDAELLNSNAQQLVEDAIDTIADFFNLGSAVQMQIPPKAVELYLKERNLDNYLAKFQAAISKSTKPKYDVDEVKKIIYAAVKDIEKEKESLKSELPASETHDTHGEDILKISDEIKQDIKYIPSEESIQREEDKSESSITDFKNLRADNPIIPRTTDLSDEIHIDKNIETFPIDSDELGELSKEKNKDSFSKSKVKNDILTFLSEREIEKIISTIFNEDKEDFATTIEAISECKTYEKATEILKKIYTSYNVNPYSREAILLTNAVAKYFTNV